VLEIREDISSEKRLALRRTARRRNTKKTAAIKSNFPFPYFQYVSSETRKRINENTVMAAKTIIL